VLSMICADQTVRRAVSAWSCWAGAPSAEPGGGRAAVPRSGAALIALAPDQQASPLAARPYDLRHAAMSPLAARPYDLRHAAMSLWLNAGVPAPTVARRAGHSVEVLLRVYAACIDGEDGIANARISDALG
jgi:hypothetical protein